MQLSIVRHGQHLEETFIGCLRFCISRTVNPVSLLPYGRQRHMIPKYLDRLDLETLVP